MFLDEIVEEIEREDKEPGAHSNIGASSAHRWMNCPASALYKSDGKSSTYAIEGTFYHKLGELRLLGKLGELDCNGFIGEKVTVLDHTFKISEMQIDGVNLYFDTVMGDAKSNEMSILEAEVRFQLSSISDKAFGTADAVVVHPFEKITVYDLKTGNKKVYPNNEQFKYYALGAIETFKPGVDEVELVVVQPPEGDGYKVKRFTLKVETLMEFKNQLAEAAAQVEKATKSDAKIGDWCKWCNGETRCTAIHNTAVAVVEFDDLETVEDVKKECIPVDKLKFFLDHGDQIKRIVDLFAEAANEMASRGTKIPGYKMVNVNARKTYTDKAVAMQTLSKFVGDKAIKVTPPTVVTMGEARKALKAKGFDKGKIEEVMDSITHKPDKGTTLVPESDGRPEVTYFDDLQTIN